ncbi:MAG: SPOR domain-containing protein [Betaproteobacteria bacterium HGW-Betaproteobacteria-18]|nr:MAG: SPOR domain-containing protein [Betaproteobacteria bacterium HGW-Betaproteobacteria-18]
MDFFKFRKKGDPAPSASVQPESVERMRQRAKHRLIGAAVLVLIGVIGFPLLFDKQPRPIAVDTPIDIPDKNKVLPLVLPESPASKVATAAPVVPDEPKVSAPQSVVITETAELPKVEKTADKNMAAEVVKPSTNAVTAKPTEADKAQALLDGKAADAPPAASEGRFVVQVGAFADAARAREVRQKLERAGLKTYTHVADTKDGQRIRVRVGPFAARADAEKAAEKIKKLNLPAVLLTL